MSMHTDIQREKDSLKRNNIIDASMNMKIEEITPYYAMKLLEMNTNNRPINKNIINNYTESMKRGKWQYNGDSIRISKTDCILDGQHRLNAIIKSGLAFQMLVIRGLPDEVFQTIDRGKKRSIGDTLHIKGYNNRFVLSAILMLIYKYNINKKNMFSKEIPSPSPDQILDIIQNDPDIINSIEIIDKRGKHTNRGLLPLSLSCFLYHILSKSGYAREARDFFHSIYNGSNIDINNPILFLRNILIEKKRGASIDQKYLTALTIKTWNAYIQNKEKFKITYDGNLEEFPQLYIPSRQVNHSILSLK